MKSAKTKGQKNFGVDLKLFCSGINETGWIGSEYIYNPLSVFLANGKIYFQILESNTIIDKEAEIDTDPENLFFWPI